MLFGRGLFRKGPGEHEFGFEDRAGAFNPAVEGGRQIAEQGTKPSNLKSRQNDPMHHHPTVQQESPTPGFPGFFADC